MILSSVVINLYTIITFSIIADEIWNIKHPRLLPAKKYYLLQWEFKDFYSYQIKGEWVLRKYRKTDSELKRKIRNKYWEKRNG